MKSLQILSKKNILNIFRKTLKQSTTQTQIVDKQNKPSIQDEKSKKSFKPINPKDASSEEEIKESKINKYFRNDIKKYDGRLN
jgi:hypothetical protein